MTLLFCVWSLFPVFIPYFSIPSLIIGITLIISGIAGGILVRSGTRRPGQILFSNALFLSMLITAIRSWFVVIGSFQVWLLWASILLILYVLAWTLPILNSRLSDFMFREQYNPQTQPGKNILNLSTRFLPVAGSIGALIGMYVSRSGGENISLLLLGFAFSLASIGLAQVTSHQFWREDRLQD